MKTNIITVDDMVDIFSKISGCSFVGLTTVTKPVLKGGKSNPHFNKITTFSHFVGFCGDSVDYQKMVNKKAIELYKKSFGEKPINQTPFTANSLWYGKGKHLSGAVVYHSETLEKYIFVFIPVNSKPKCVYFLENKRIDKNEIIGFPEKNDIKTVNFENTSVEVKIIPRVFKLSSIKSFNLDGINHVIKH